MVTCVVGSRWSAVVERGGQGFGFTLTHINGQHVLRLVDKGGPAWYVVPCVPRVTWRGAMSAACDVA